MATEKATRSEKKKNANASFVLARVFAYPWVCGNTWRLEYDQQLWLFGSQNWKRWRPSSEMSSARRYSRIGPNFIALTKRPCRISMTIALFIQRHAFHASVWFEFFCMNMYTSHMYIPMAASHCYECTIEQHSSARRRRSARINTHCANEKNAERRGKDQKVPLTQDTARLTFICIREVNKYIIRMRAEEENIKTRALINNIDTLLHRR